jgi:decaprenylphospho-beta-D-erythro-pentofuranosid-2-ulose 2-reductase
MSTKKTALILGATSDIAKETAKELAAHGYHLLLSAREPQKLTSFVEDFMVEHPLTRIHTVTLDIEDLASHQEFYQELNPKPDIVICAIGYLGSEIKAQTETAECAQILGVNFTYITPLLNIIANDFKVRKSGIIVGIGSVAGDRGRQSNGHYGAAKAGFHAYLSALRNRMSRYGVTVITVKPGFIKTKMTTGLSAPKPLIGSPQQVAKDIYDAITTKKDIIYTPSRWKWVMGIIKRIPEGIFKKLSL